MIDHLFVFWLKVRNLRDGFVAVFMAADRFTVQEHSRARLALSLTLEVELEALERANEVLEGGALVASGTVVAASALQRPKLHDHQQELQRGLQQELQERPRPRPVVQLRDCNRSSSYASRPGYGPNGFFGKATKQIARAR